MSPEFDDGPDLSEMGEIVSGPSNETKRRRVSDQNKNLEVLTQHLKDSQNKKMELLEKMIAAPQEQSELQLFFASICKTVEKFTLLDQAIIKMDIIKIVNEMEISHLKAKHIVVLDGNFVPLDSANALSNNLYDTTNTDDLLTF